MPYDINSQQIDIENLFKQNVNDLASIKELYRKLEEMEKKISQIKYINEVIGDKLKKEYESLKDLIQNGTGQPVPGQPGISQTELNNKFNTINTRIDNLNNEIDEINLQIDNIMNNGAGLTDEEKQNISEIPQLKNTVEEHTQAIRTLQSNSSSSNVNSEWSGKVASFLGDSITFGVHTTKKYHEYLKELIGFSFCNNYGVDGASITNHYSGICTRYKNVANNSDIIFIFGGTNDFYYNKPLGEWYSLNGTTRTLNKDVSTFRGALAEICDGLITKFPTKQIVLMTPIHRFTFNNQQTDLQANASGLYLDNYVECVKEAGRIFGIPVIDLNGESGLYPMNTENGNAFFNTTDKLHPNANGHLKIARVIQGKLKTILPLNLNFTPNVYGNIVLSKTSITMNEGTSESFTVKLDKAPTNSQVVTLSVNNTDVTLSTNTLTFTSDNYNQAQEVRINVTEDSDKTNDNCTITLSSSGVSNKTVTLIINDITIDDTPTPTTYSISNNLTNVTSNNSSTSIAEGSSYSATLTANSGFTLETVTVSMGGIDITSTAYSNGSISISSVTGNIVINATATKQASSGTGEYRDVTVDDVTLINSTLNIDSNGYKLITTNQWNGVRLTNVPKESKITLLQTNTGQCIWYMYKYDDSYMYVLCIGKGGGEHGKVYKLSITTNSASQISTIEMPTIPNPGDILKIVVSGATQTLYCNDTELCTLTDCNTVGISNQRQPLTPYVASKWTILEN